MILKISVKRLLNFFHLNLLSVFIVKTLNIQSLKYLLVIRSSINFFEKFSQYFLIKQMLKYDSVFAFLCYHAKNDFIKFKETF